MPLFGRSRSQPVTCHFCGQTTQNPIRHKSGWLCPDSSCGQYNGFNADGDYNLNQNVVQEFPSSQSLPPRHCKPTPLPFASANGFHSDSHFHRNTYIPSSAAAPLCSQCQRNQDEIQSKLRTFDPGANSNYNAFVEYRALLERSYPLCAHCRSQTQLRLQSVNHNARLWQKYQESLPSPDLTRFRSNANTQNGPKLNHQFNRRRDRRENGYCCSSFLRCILYSMLWYISSLVTLMGLSSRCVSHWNTPKEIIHRCDISLSLISCRDIGQSVTPCIYIHHFRSSMEGYLSIMSTEWTQSVLSSTLLLLIWMLYDGNTHHSLHYTTFLISNLVLIVLPILKEDIIDKEWEGSIGMSYTVLQIAMLFICLLFTTRRRRRGRRKKRGKRRRLSHSSDARTRTRRSGRKSSNNDLLNLLEKQEVSEGTPPPRFQSDLRQKIYCKPTEQKNDKMTNHLPSNQVISNSNLNANDQTQPHTPFFESPFDPRNEMKGHNQWAHIKLNDPFVVKGRCSEQRSQTMPMSLKQQHSGSHRVNKENEKGSMNSKIGINREYYGSPHRRHQSYQSHQPMDLCSPHMGMRSGSPLNMRKVQQRIGGLDLNSSFDGML